MNAKTSWVWTRAMEYWKQAGKLPVRELSYFQDLNHTLPTFKIHLVLEPGLEFDFNYRLDPRLGFSTDDVAWDLFTALVKATTPDER